MRTLRIISSARARKLRKLGERVWWIHDGDGWGVLVWDITASKRQRARGRA